MESPSDSTPQARLQELVRDIGQRSDARQSRFAYTAQDANGTLLQDVIIAENLTSAVTLLARRSLLVVDIKRVKQGLSLPRLTPRRADPKAVIRFTRCLGTMLHAGLDIIKTLDILSRQEPDTVLKHALEDIGFRLQEGASYSAAFAAHPEAFSRLYLALLKVGETTGSMVMVASQLADFLERDDRSVSQARAAIRYPTFVFGSALLMVWGLFTWVLPPLLETCAQLAAPGSVLPLPTRILMATMLLVRNPFVELFVLGTVAGGSWFYRSYRTTPQGRYQIDRGVLSIPMVGDLVQRIVLARFARCWGMMIEAGISIHSSLDVLSRYLDNAVFRQDAVKPLADALMAGVDISVAMEDIEFFPRLAVNLVSAGEWCGELSRMLFSMADVYDNEVKNAVEMILAAIEPVMTGAMGVLVCFVLLAIFLPLYQVVMSIGH